MRASVFLYLVGFALILILLFVVGQGLLVAESLARVVDLVGTAQVQPKGEAGWKGLALGQLVKAGDTVRTGAEAEVDLGWAGGTHVRLGPNTTFKVMRAQINYSTRGTTTQANLSLGKVWVRLRKMLKPKTKFEVKTPTIVAAVRGTIFSVEVAPDGSTQVEVYEGRVSVAKGKEQTSLREREVAAYSRVAAAAEKPTGMSAERARAWAEKRSIVGAFLSVEQPQEGARASAPVLAVSGYTDVGNAVEVNGMKAAVNRRGFWSAQVALNRGENLLTIHVLDEEGRQNTILRKVIY